MSGIAAATTIISVSTPRRMAALLAASLLLAGCGIRFSAAPQGNDFFDSLDVTGDKRVGETLTAAVALSQFYPVEVAVECELLEDSETLKPIGREVVPAMPNGSPERTPFPWNYSFDFTVDDPGEYYVDCFTPLDEDNFIREVIDIGEPAEATPTPITTGGELGLRP